MKIKTQEDAKKTKYSGSDALAVARQASKVIAAKGKKITEFKADAIRDEPDDLLAAITGPTGNLRAPAIRVGKTLLIGFNEEVYADVFG